MQSSKFLAFFQLLFQCPRFVPRILFVLVCLKHLIYWTSGKIPNQLIFYKKHRITKAGWSCGPARFCSLALFQQNRSRHVASVRASRGRNVGTQFELPPFTSIINLFNPQSQSIFLEEKGEDSIRLVFCGGQLIETSRSLVRGRDAHSIWKMNKDFFFPLYFLWGKWHSLYDLAFCGF